MTKKLKFLSLFFVINLISCSNLSSNTYLIDENIKILSPLGAPTLGIYESILSSNCTTTSTPTSIPIELQNKNSEYNFIVFESSNALKLIKNNKADYKFLGLLTKGNFHFVGFNKTNKDIPSKDDYIVSFQKGSITDLSLNYVLPSIYNENKDNIHYLNGVSQVATVLKSGLHEGNKVDWALIAEPSLYALKSQNNFDDNESNDIYEYLDINRALKEKTNSEYDFIPQAGLFVKNSFYNENKEIVEQYLKNSVTKNLDEAINTPSKIISKLEELNISDEEFELKFGFKKDYILALQDNKENRFGIASSDNLITGSNFISEEKIDSFISLIS